ncbi:MAG: hypothetical protein QME54_02960 [Actinomycetota bacterium]|nr:hypothetical protein [Actinomycetota bacterium]
MGLIDSYPGDWHFIAEDFFQKVEVKCIDWRWRIKDKGYRLSRVHGDFHPWNVLFQSGLDFWVLDRSLVCQPFYAWRALVIASPIWYPNLTDDVRKKLFNFIINVLDFEKFDIHNVNSYFEPPDVKSSSSTVHR